MCTLPLFAFFCRMAEPTPYLFPFFLPPEISLFWGTSISITPSGIQEVLPTPVRRKYSTGSSLLISLSMTLTCLPFCIGSRSSPDICFAPSCLALFCSWEVLQDLGSDHLPIVPSVSLSLRSFAPTSVILLSTFRKLAGMTLPYTLTLTLLSHRNTPLFLFHLPLLSLPF